ncbi:MAG: hypothetical protein BJ554DRAFT_7291 [Olpidium bornovanus]|uniref:Uncharacterized protein n=1 Tax=Olpidium bornovanus TaxID=278681 RepID=A0A8H7ZWB8_9FUNG|nr:MAG: hypothetical protein BJ554DRAFT_7291 [Olpidium bornovanus]
MRLAAASATPAARAWCSRSRAAAQWRSSASLRRPREGNRRFRPRSPRQPSAVAPSAAEHLSGRGARRPPLSSSAGTVTAACVRTTGAACLSLRPARMPQGAPRGAPSNLAMASLSSRSRSQLFSSPKAPAAFSQLRAALQVRPFTSSSAGAPAAVPQLPTVPGCTAVYVSTCTDPWTNLAVEEW